MQYLQTQRRYFHRRVDCGISASASLALAPLDDACGLAPPLPDLSGQIALVANSTAACSYFTIVATAQAANASGLIVYSDEGQPAIDMNCETPEQCDDQSVGLPATMVSYADGLRLRQSALEVR